MKKHLFMAIVVVSISMPATYAHSAPRRSITENTEMYSERCKSKQFAPALSRGSWQPTVVKTYSWDFNNDCWNAENYSQTIYTYDDEGRLVEEVTGDFVKNTYTYNDDGMLAELATFLDDGDNDYKPHNKQVYGYDSIVKDAIISCDQYSNRDGELFFSGGYRYDITRDENDNVVKVELHERYVDEDSMTQYLTIEYDANGAACSISRFMIDLSDNQLKLRDEIKDIVWLNTDGQFTNTYIQVQSLCEGANRIKTAIASKTAYMPDGMSFVCEYPDNHDSYVYSLKYDGKLVQEGSTTYSGIYGGFKYEENTYDFSEDNEGWTIGPDVKSTTVWEERYDKFGLTLYYYKERTGDLYPSKIQGEVTYDDETGLPSEYIEISKSGVYEVRTKYVYSDYVEVAGLKSIGNNSADEAPEYYDLRGIRVNGDNLPSGIYIERRGAKVNKILVK